MYNRLELVHVCADMTQMLWKTGLLMLTSVGKEGSAGVIKTLIS